MKRPEIENDKNMIMILQQTVEVMLNDKEVRDVMDTKTYMTSVFISLIALNRLASGTVHADADDYSAYLDTTMVEFESILERSNTGDST